MESSRWPSAVTSVRIWRIDAGRSDMRGAY
jgi:hypothetical protein